MCADVCGDRAGAAAGKGRELPAAFAEEMRELFGKLPGVSVSELPAFLESLQGERSFGLRRNPLKYTGEEQGTPCGCFRKDTAQPWTPSVG